MIPMINECIVVIKWWTFIYSTILLSYAPVLFIKLYCTIINSQLYFRYVTRQYDLRLTWSANLCFLFI